MVSSSQLPSMRFKFLGHILETDNETQPARFGAVDDVV